MKSLFTGICVLSLAYYSHGQAQTHALRESTPVVISSNPDLSAQRAQLDAKQSEINQALSSSRAQVAKLNDEFRVLKEEYLRLLQVELKKTTNTQWRVQLQEEITQYSEKSNPQTH